MCHGHLSSPLHGDGWQHLSGRTNPRSGPGQHRLCTVHQHRCWTCRNRMHVWVTFHHQPASHVPVVQCSSQPFLPLMFLRMSQHKTSATTSTNCCDTHLCCTLHVNNMHVQGRPTHVSADSAPQRADLTMRCPAGFDIANTRTRMQSSVDWTHKTSFGVELQPSCQSSSACLSQCPGPVAQGPGKRHAAARGQEAAAHCFPLLSPAYQPSPSGHSTMQPALPLLVTLFGRRSCGSTFLAQASRACMRTTLL